MLNESRNEGKMQKIYAELQRFMTDYLDYN